MATTLRVNNLGLPVASELCGADIIIDDFCPDNYCYIIDGRNDMGFDNVTVLMNTTRHRELQDNIMQTRIYPKWIETLMEEVQNAYMYTCKPLSVVPNPKWDLFTKLYPVTKVNGTITIQNGHRGGKKTHSDAMKRLIEFRHKVETMQPKKPSWFDLMQRERDKYIETHFGLSDAFRGASTAIFEHYNSFEQFRAKYEQGLARYNALWKPQVLWGTSEASRITGHVKAMNKILEEQNNKAGHVYEVDLQEPFWDTLIIDDPMMDELLVRGTFKKFHTNKKEKRSMFKFWRTVKLQAEKVELIWNALRWFGLIAWDTFDEQYITNKDGVCTRTGITPAVTLSSLRGQIADNSKRVESLLDQKLDERVDSLEMFTDDGKEARDMIVAMFNHYFVDDYFAGEKGYIGYEGETVHGLIPKTEMKSFRVLEDCCGDGCVSTAWTTKANFKLRTQQINKMEIDVVNYLKEKEEDK